ncbi:MAG: PKD domain-containing protein [Thermoplasmata archaeon]|nr:PKD domain-containing protein [Thermoplasmata archaeon]
MASKPRLASGRRLGPRRTLGRILLTFLVLVSLGLGPLVLPVALPGTLRSSSDRFVFPPGQGSRPDILLPPSGLAPSALSTPPAVFEGQRSPSPDLRSLGACGTPLPMTQLARCAPPAVVTPAPFVPAPVAPNWTLLGGTIGTPPNVTDWPSIAYDPEDGALVILAQVPNAPAGSDGTATWELANHTWARLVNATTASGGLPSFVGTQMAYDADLGEIVAFGGGFSGAASEGFTWTFDDQHWTNVTPANLSPANSPAARYSGGMAYDPIMQAIVLFGGYRTDSSYHPPLNDTWTFGRGGWTNITATASATGGPQPRGDLQMAFDSYVGEIVLAGGYGDQSSVNWGFANGSWSPIYGPGLGSRWNAAIADVPTAKELLVYGGWGRCSIAVAGGACNDSWVYAGGSWSFVGASGGPGQLGGAVMTYDPQLHGVLLIGGENTTNHLPVPPWLATFPLTAAPAQVTPNPSAVGTPLLVQAFAQGGPTGVYTFSWSGLPPGCQTTPPGPASAINCTATTAGTYRVELYVNDSGGGPSSASPSAPVVVVNAPVEGLVAASRSSADGGQSFSFSADVIAPGVRPDTFAWQVNGSGAICAPTISPVLTCIGAEAGGPLVATATLIDANGERALGTAGAILVHPTLRTLIGLPRVAIEPGTPATVDVEAQGGEPPFLVVWDGLPPSCGSTGAIVRGCVFPSAGVYNLSARTVDANGQLSVAPAAGLRVLPGPVLQGVGTNLTRIEVGVAVSFLAQVAGGTPPYSFAWNVWGGGSCGPPSTPELDCAFAAAHAARLTVSVVDRLGGTASVSNLTYHVFAGPTVRLLLDSSTLPAGSPIPAKAVVMGGQGPYRYRWLIDGGEVNATTAPSASLNAPGAGNFTVQVEVADSVGARGFSIPQPVTLLTTGRGPLTSGNATNGLAVPLVAVGALGAGGLAVAIVLLRRRRARAVLTQEQPVDEYPR